MCTLEDAIVLATEAHADQTDKAGAPYVLHLLRAMQAQTTEEAMMAEVLHDPVEDTGFSFDDLRERGYSGEVIEALRHVTKRDGESYQEFAERAGQHPIARQVKIADLEDNTDVTRLNSVTKEDARRLMKYRRAHEKLVRQDEPRNDSLGSPSGPSTGRKRETLVETLRNRTPGMETWIGRMERPGQPYKREDFVWHFLLQSLATWGNSRGHEGLIGTDENYRGVTYEAPEGIPTERRPERIEEVLRDAKVRYPEKKSRYLSENVEIIRKMGGPEAAREQVLDRPDAEAKIEFVDGSKASGTSMLATSGWTFDTQTSKTKWLWTGGSVESLSS